MTILACVMNLTADQKRVIAGMCDAFSKRLVRARIVPRTNGVVHLSIETPSGRWQLEVQPSGRLINPRFTQRLFSEPNSVD